MDFNHFSTPTTAGPPPPIRKPVGSGSRLHPVSTASCMDLRQRDQDEWSHEIRPRQSTSSFSQTRASAEARTEVRPQPYSSPLPQAQWPEVPLPYRPRDWPDPRDQPLQLPQSSRRERRPRPAIPGRALSNANVPAPLRPRRSPGALPESTSLRERPGPVQSVEHSLNPQPNHYDSRVSFYSSPGELEHMPRSVSRPSTPDSGQQHSYEDEPDPVQGIPRHPTYPPAGRRRTHTPTRVGDAAFADEEEFRLFVQATACLGPEQAFRNTQSHFSPNSSQPQRSGNDNGHAGSLGSPSADHILSPSEATITPTTTRALQGVAQMPEGSKKQSMTAAVTQFPQMPEASSAAGRRRRLHSTGLTLDRWLETPSAPPPAVPGIGLFDDLDDMPPPDDELPDYASSQAQAQAAQRLEAARRAQELQRRWKASERG